MRMGMTRRMPRTRARQMRGRWSLVAVAAGLRRLQTAAMSGAAKAGLLLALHLTAPGLWAQATLKPHASR